MFSAVVPFKDSSGVILRVLYIIDFLDKPTIIGLLRDWNDSSSFNILKLSSIDLPNPNPGSIIILSKSNS